MGEDGEAGAVGVTRFQGADDCTMFFLVADAPLGGDHAVFQLAPFGLVAHGGGHVEDAGHETVVGRCRQGLMQRRVPDFKIVERRATLGAV